MTHEIPEAITREELIREYPGLVASDLRLAREFDVLEEARKILCARGQDEVASDVERVQEDLAVLLSDIINTLGDRKVVHNAQEAAEHAGFESFAVWRRAVEKWGDNEGVQDEGTHLVLAAWVSTDGDDPEFSEWLAYPFLASDIEQTRQGLQYACRDWEAEFGPHRCDQCGEEVPDPEDHAPVTCSACSSPDVGSHGITQGEQILHCSCLSCGHHWSYREGAA